MKCHNQAFAVHKGSVMPHVLLHLAGFFQHAKTTGTLGLQTYSVSLSPAQQGSSCALSQQSRVYSERCFPISSPGTGLKPGDRGQSLQLVCQSQEGGGFPAQAGHGHLQWTTAHLCSSFNFSQLFLPPATICSLTQQSSR